ncbi:recombinase family protein [Caballeronia sp. LjRoot34]|jgi:hypothetical protein
MATENKRHQYDLAESARKAGFANVTVIDDDLGRSGSGLTKRPGFQKLVAAICSSTVCAVFCIEASRLTRNGRDWHHLVNLCALTGTLIVDPDGAHDLRLTNDRLLLGLNGSMSEYELSLLREESSVSHCRRDTAGMSWGASSWTRMNALRKQSVSCFGGFASWQALGRYFYGPSWKKFNSRCEAKRRWQSNCVGITPLITALSSYCSILFTLEPMYSAGRVHRRMWLTGGQEKVVHAASPCNRGMSCWKAIIRAMSPAMNSRKIRR